MWTEYEIVRTGCEKAFTSVHSLFDTRLLTIFSDSHGNKTYFYYIFTPPTTTTKNKKD